MQALFLNVIIVTVFILILFFNVTQHVPYGTPPVILTVSAAKTLINNVKGLSFLLVNSLMFPAITLVVIQMPL